MLSERAAISLLAVEAPDPLNIIPRLCRNNSASDDTIGKRLYSVCRVYIISLHINQIRRRHGVGL